MLRISYEFRRERFEQKSLAGMKKICVKTQRLKFVGHFDRFCEQFKVDGEPALQHEREWY